MKKYRKFLSLLLALVMTMSLCVPALAVEDDAEKESYMFGIDGGKLYSAQIGEKVIVALTNDSSHLVDIAITYTADRSEVYHWGIRDYPESVFAYTDAFWDDVVLYAESRMGEADIVTFETGAITQSLRSSASADLREELRTYLGSSEYYGRLKNSTTYQNVSFKTYEKLEFSTSLIRTKSWSKSAPITVSTFIASVLGLVSTSALVSAICNVYCVTVSALSELDKSGKINIYSCCGMYSRYTTKASGSSIYNTTYKYVTYTGYEDGNDNDSRAYIDSSSAYIEYDKSESYFNNYSLQVQDAYQAYQIMG